METGFRETARPDASEAERALIDARNELSRTQEVLTKAGRRVRRLQKELAEAHKEERRQTGGKWLAALVLIGGGIGGLTMLLALRRDGMADWRAAASLGLLGGMGFVVAFAILGGASMFARETTRLASPRYERGKAAEIRHQLEEAKRLLKGVSSEDQRARKALKAAQEAFGVQGGQLALSAEGGELALDGGSGGEVAIEGASGALSPSDD